MREVFVVGDMTRPEAWEVIGVFDSKELAEAACIEPTHFVGPIELNKTTPKETLEWPNAYYPIPMPVEGTT